MHGVTVDVETTGLGNSDAIISIALVRFNGWKIEEILSTLVDPHRGIPTQITKLTGIDNKKVLGSPTFIQLKDDILFFVEKLPILAYNSPFETRFIGDLLKRRGNGYTLVDVLKKVKQAYKLDSYKLKDVAFHFKIPFNHEHQALDDALVCYHLVNILEGRGEW